MIRGTTPTLTFKINTDLDFSEIETAEITFKSVSGMKEKTWNQELFTIDPQEKTIVLTLTQDDTLYFYEGEIQVQLRIKMQDDKVYASNIVTSTLSKILKEGVI